MHVCLFDIDGTLLSSGGAGKAAMETALREEFGVARLRGRVPFSGRTDRAIGGDLLLMHDLPQSAENWRRLREAYLRRLSGFLHHHQGGVLPGIAGLLAALTRRADAALGLLTGNIREGARIKLEHFGLHHNFRFGGFGDEHLCRDDVAREAIAAAQTHLNGSLQMNKVWVIGDTPLDVRCARAVGARVVAVATGWHSRADLAASEPDVLLDDFRDPSLFLDRWQ